MIGLRSAITLAAALFAAAAAAEPILLLQVDQDKLTLDQSDIAQVETVLDGNNLPALTFRLGNTATLSLADFTGNHLGQRVRLILCGDEVSSPIVQAPILNVGVMISGQTTAQYKWIEAVLRGEQSCPLAVY